MTVDETQDLRQQAIDTGIAWMQKRQEMREAWAVFEEKTLELPEYAQVAALDGEETALGKAFDEMNRELSQVLTVDELIEVSKEIGHALDWPEDRMDKVIDAVRPFLDEEAKGDPLLSAQISEAL